MSFVMHSANHLKIDQGGEIKNRGLCPAGIIRHQIFHVSE